VAEQSRSNRLVGSLKPGCRQRQVQYSLFN